MFRLTQSTVMQRSNFDNWSPRSCEVIEIPKSVAPVATTLGELLTFMFELAVILVFVAVTGEGFSLTLLVLPAVIAVHTVFNFGCALIAARLNDSFRDFQQFLPFLFQIFGISQE